MKRIIALFSLVLVGSFTSAVNAQGVMDEVYGRGVHAYFAGDDAKAIEWLESVIAAGSQDPRVYYFRALANIRQGGGSFETGLEDVRQAALLEITSGRVVNVSRALERIQGETRRQIEDVRLKVRLENKDRLPKPPVVTPGPANLDSTTDPFADDARMGQPEDMPPAAAPADTTAPTTPEPAESTPAPADTTEPSGADPFGGAEEKADEPATEPDPFAS